MERRAPRPSGSEVAGRGRPALHQQGQSLGAWIDLKSEFMMTLSELEVPDMASGIIDVLSRYSVSDTLARLQSILKEKGLTVFALVDHSGEAEKAGLKMRPTQLVIFGSPKGGTPLMVAAPRLAIDLPLKALAWQDERGKVWLSYNSPEYLQQRHGFPADLLKNIAGIGALIQKAVE
jgi:uncharacterized protein (DUF302 family)